MKLQVYCKTDCLFIVSLDLSGSLTKGGDGADIYVVDDLKPSSGGTMATCRRTSKSYNMFCNGSSKINDQGSVENTDCKKKGVAGRIGRGRCNV